MSQRTAVPPGRLAPPDAPARSVGPAPPGPTAPATRRWGFHFGSIPSHAPDHGEERAADLVAERAMRSAVTLPADPARHSPTPAASQLSPDVQGVLAAPGQRLDPGVRAFLEPRLGHCFGDVRIHADPAAAASARAQGALAYTVGRDVVFGAGRYEPGSTAGRQLLAHELAHVVQQADRGTARLQCKRDPAAAPHLRWYEQQQLDALEAHVRDWSAEERALALDCLSQWFELRHQGMTATAVAGHLQEELLAIYERWLRAVDQERQAECKKHPPGWMEKVYGDPCEPWFEHAYQNGFHELTDYGRWMRVTFDASEAPYLIVSGWVEQLRNKTNADLILPRMRTQALIGMAAGGFGGLGMRMRGEFYGTPIRLVPRSVVRKLVLFTELTMRGVADVPPLGPIAGGGPAIMEPAVPVPASSARPPTRPVVPVEAPTPAPVAPARVAPAPVAPAATTAPAPAAAAEAPISRPERPLTQVDLSRIGVHDADAQPLTSRRRLHEDRPELGTPMGFQTPIGPELVTAVGTPGHQVKVTSRDPHVLISADTKRHREDVRKVIEADPHHPMRRLYDPRTRRFRAPPYQHGNLALWAQHPYDWQSGHFRSQRAGDADVLVFQTRYRNQEQSARLERTGSVTRDEVYVIGGLAVDKQSAWDLYFAGYLDLTWDEMLALPTMPL